MSTHHSHVFDSYIAELGLVARSRRRTERASASQRGERTERVAPAPGAAEAVALAVSAWPAAASTQDYSALGTPPSRRHWGEPRVVSRNRGDRPARPGADGGRPCLGLG